MGAVHARRLRRRRRRHREHRARERIDRTNRRHHAGVRHGVAGVERGRSEPAARRRPTSSASRSTARRRRQASAPATRTPSPIRFRTSRAATTATTRSTARSTSTRPITGGNACVNDTSGDPITDPLGNCGFPGFDGMLAKNTLGYVAAMQEARRAGHVRLHLRRARSPRADARDRLVLQLGDWTGRDRAQAAAEPTTTTPSRRSSSDLAAARHHAEEHAVRHHGRRGRPLRRRDRRTPQAGGNWLVYDHTHVHERSARARRTRSARSTSNMNALLPAGQSHRPFDASTSTTRRRSTSTASPARTDPAVRKLERDVGALTLARSVRPERGGVVQTVPFTQASPTRSKRRRCTWSTPTRSGRRRSRCSANPDFFFTGVESVFCGVHQCVTRSFAWNHGDIQDEIGNTWLGFVGPGVRTNGVDSTTWTDHTNVRPTILSLARPEGRLRRRRPRAHRRVELRGYAAGRRTLTACARLMAAYEQVNASFGNFSKYTLSGVDEGAHKHGRCTVQLDRGLDHESDDAA